MIFTRADVMRYKKLMNKAAESLPDEEALTVPNLFEHWEPDKQYTTGKRLSYNDILYSVLQDHTSQATWTPDVTASLYTKVLIPDPTVIPEWEQPSSTNPYMTGDKVRHNGKTWISTIDNNVWEPGVYGWEEI